MPLRRYEATNALAHPKSSAKLASDETLVILHFYFYFSIFFFSYHHAFTAQLQGLWTMDKPHMRGKEDVML